MKQLLICFALMFSLAVPLGSADTYSNKLAWDSNGPHPVTTSEYFFRGDLEKVALPNYSIIDIELRMLRETNHELQKQNRKCDWNLR